MDQDFLDVQYVDNKKDTHIINFTVIDIFNLKMCDIKKKLIKDV